MTPFQIEMMLHIYSIAEPIPNLRYEGAQREAINWFLAEKLIEVAGDRASGYELAPRGEAYVRFLTSMPLPVANWVIPGPWLPSEPSRSE
jgi:hypothetical protein